MVAVPPQKSATPPVVLEVNCFAKPSQATEKSERKASPSMCV